jgi:Amidohydrolase
VLFAAYDPVGGYLFEQCVQGRLLLGVQDRKHSLFCLGERVLDLGESASFIEVLGFGRPSSIVEFPFDTARNITNGLYTGFFQRHPGLRLILAHCGGALPTLGWRIGEHSVMGRGPHDADIDPTHVAQVLHGLYYETALAGSRNSLLPTLEVTTADHILFRTDWPALPEATVVRNIANLTIFDGFTAKQLRGVDATTHYACSPDSQLRAGASGNDAVNPDSLSRTTFR